MKKLFAGIAAEIIYGLALLAASKVSDAAVVRNLRRLIRLVEWAKPGDHLITVLGDAVKIFESPESAKLARRMVLEARPSQFKSLIRGSLI